MIAKAQPEVEYGKLYSRLLQTKLDKVYRVVEVTRGGSHGGYVEY